MDLAKERSEDGVFRRWESPTARSFHRLRAAARVLNSIPAGNGRRSKFELSSSFDRARDLETSDAVRSIESRDLQIGQLERLFGRGSELWTNPMRVMNKGVFLQVQMSVIPI